MSRLVFVTGDKGGVGKSFTSRALTDWYIDRGVTVKAFDTDKTNSTLFRFFSKDTNEKVYLKQLDIENQALLDEFLENIAASKENEITLFDCGASAMDKLLVWMNEVGFIELAKNLGIRITIAFVLGPEKDCVAILKDFANTFQNDVQYVLIKNNGKGKEFKVYDESKSRELILKTYQSVEIELPALFAKTSLEVDRLNLPFYRAVNDQKLMIADRQRVITYRSKLFDQLSKAEDMWT